MPAGWSARAGAKPEWPISRSLVGSTCLLLAIAGLLLWRRSAKSSWVLLGALLLGLTLIPIMLPDIFHMPASLYIQLAWYLRPVILQAVLLVAVWGYSLRLRKSGYLK